jgi:nucleoside-diphosphate-sugar epimerase
VRLTTSGPTPETAEAEPMSAYGQSKYCAERYVRWEKRLYGMSTVTLRYGNVFGPRQNPHGDAGVIAIFCGRALEGQPPKVFGDGTQTRDYIFVGDVVAANLLAADHADAGGEYNIGTEVESTVLDIIGRSRRTWTTRVLRTVLRARPPRRVAALLPGRLARAGGARVQRPDVAHGWDRCDLRVREAGRGGLTAVTLRPSGGGGSSVVRACEVVDRFRGRDDGPALLVGLLLLVLGIACGALKRRCSS